MGGMCEKVVSLYKLSLLFLCNSRVVFFALSKLIYLFMNEHI